MLVHWKAVLKSFNISEKHLKNIQEIPIYLIDTQVELSQLKDKLNAISAGILTLGDVINLNKQFRKGELASFFMIMEVYGHNAVTMYTKGNFGANRKEKIKEIVGG